MSKTQNVEKATSNKKGLSNDLEPNTSKLFYTRLDVSKMLHVSLVTLNKWNKNGTLKAHGIGRRVLYRVEDINNSIVKL